MPHSKINPNAPISKIIEWMQEAGKHEINDHNAVSLATVDQYGIPNVRIVLIKHIDQKGLVFHTNKKSAKANEIKNNQNAAMGFHWKSVYRQIRIRGKIKPITNNESNAYFQSRPRQSQIGAWASKQSQSLENYQIFQEEMKLFEKKFQNKNIPKPIWWGGYRLVPNEIEFWTGKEFRLHERTLYKRKTHKHKWEKEYLYP